MAMDVLQFLWIAVLIPPELTIPYTSIGKLQKSLQVFSIPASLCCC
jgi:hypothetical protein